MDQLQSEQGARFLRKRNRNMIIDVTGEVEPHDDFHWLTLGQIQRLLRADNIVNMDARTVLACASMCADAASLPTGDPEAVEVAGRRLEGFAKDVLLSLSSDEPGLHSMDGLLSWLSEMKSRAELSTETVPLDELRGWRRDGDEIRHESGKHFSVIAVSVEAGSREVVSWTQPLLRHFSIGLTGFLAKKIDGTLHFLARASVEPGNFDVADIGPTVAVAGAEDGRWDDPPPPFMDRFLTASTSAIRYSAVQSEEGGRFYHFSEPLHDRRALAGGRPGDSRRLHLDDARPTARADPLRPSQHRGAEPAGLPELGMKILFLGFSRIVQRRLLPAAKRGTDVGPGGV